MTDLVSQDRILTNDEMAAAISELRHDVLRLTRDIEKLANNRASPIGRQLNLFSAQFQDQLSERIRANPLGAVAIAAGCGYLLKWLRGVRRH
jgi:ElaB/YqjD/DUF883 family membrane-anchored ribosome-binding protein